MMIAKLRDAGATEVIQHGASWFEADTYLRGEFIENQFPSQTPPDSSSGSGSGSGLAETVNIYVPPFDHPLVWEGAGGMIAEMARQLPPREQGEQGVFPADVIVCSVGGGGLFNGVIEGLEKYIKASPSSSSSSSSSTSTAGVSPTMNVRVLAVETSGADSLAHSLRQGKLSSLTTIESQATSLGALCVAEKTFANAVSPPAGIDVTSVVGSDAEAARGAVRLADETRLQVELACGISLEVALGERLKEVIPDLKPETRVVVVVCGGSNITAEMIAEYRVKLRDGWV
jgi:L-serine/L-threonine ammonia-lyase